MMKEKIDTLLEEIENAKVASEEELESFRMRFISRKSVIGDLFSGLKDIPNEQKKEMGQHLNQLKNAAQEKFKQLIDELKNTGSDQEDMGGLDVTLPTYSRVGGNLHPITVVKDRIIRIFEKVGFNVVEGPEIEDDWHNFTALNFPPSHPAREMQDTFFIKKTSSEDEQDILLRTHTSNAQIRLMEQQEPPLRSIMPGRVYRNEAISARAHCFFNQVEGLYVNKGVSFKDLKDTIFYFAREMFGKDTKVRFRPSYFPFTEPSAEIDISCFICDQKGCKICKHTGWVEIGGCGMVHPNVLKNVEIDPEGYTGFAFGMGVERITMLKYQIDDLRLFSENDLRFLKQFPSAIYGA